jgi:hypothetical protein
MFATRSRRRAAVQKRSGAGLKGTQRRDENQSGELYTNNTTSDSYY